MYAFFEFKIKVRLRQSAWHGYQWCVRNCYGKVLCFFFVILLHKNPREIFPYGAPLLPTGILGKLTPPLPPGKSDPFCGGGVDIFWNQTIELYKVT